MPQTYAVARRGEETSFVVQILHLQGIRYIFQLNIFLYCLFAFMGVAIIFLSLGKQKKWMRKSKEKQMEEAYS